MTSTQRVVARSTAIVLALLVAGREVIYYFTHLDGPGVSPLLIGLAVAVVLLGLAQTDAPRADTVGRKDTG